MTFAAAVKAAANPVSSAFRKGKQALKGEHRGLVECKKTRRFTGSIDLDGTLANVESHRNSNRWDYGIGFEEPNGREVAIWIEFHTASTNQVECILQKLRWLSDWLHDDGVALESITRRERAGKSFYWLATPAGVHIRPGSRQAIQLQQAGLDLPREKLFLR